jgi:hypothetical protein
MRIRGTSTGRAARERRWALLRLALGFLQVFGASLGAGLLLMVGATGLTLLVVLLTGLCTTASILLFAGRSPRHGTPSRRR